MGMFDDVRVNVPLPDGHTGAFQTKDMECVLNMYEITAEGRLCVEDCDWEAVPPAERPYPDAAEGSLEQVIGSVRRVNLRLRDLDFHGILNFYGHDERGQWREYNAKFTDGQLVEIKVVER